MRQVIGGMLVYLFWVGVGLLVSVPATLATWLLALHVYLRLAYLHLMGRIFTEKPLFIVPRGVPMPGGEAVRFPTADGLRLNAVYWKTSVPRKGVILFGLEFGSDCWSSWQYCEHL